MNTWRDLGPLFIGDGSYLILSCLAKIRETFEFESWLGALEGRFRVTGFGDHSGRRIRGSDP